MTDSKMDSIVHDAGRSSNISDGDGNLEAGAHKEYHLRFSNNNLSNRSRNMLERYINLPPAIAFSITIMSTWPSLSLSLQAGLYNGGPTALVWGMLLAGFGSTAIAAVLGEMASITPQVGAQYRWTGIYAPKFLNPHFWSLIQGWLTLFAWITLCAVWPFLTALLLQGVVILNYPDYVPERWHATLIMWALLAIPVFANIFARRLLVLLEIIGGVLHIVFFFCIIITLLVLSPRSTSSFVFTTSFYGQSGWDSEFVQWCLGLLTTTGILCGFDGSLHLSDEVKDAPRKVPVAMITSMVVNSIIGFIYLIIILYCIGDVSRVLNTTTDFAIIEIFYQTTGSVAWATVLSCMVVIPSLICQFGVFASVSRLVWAFAMDNGLPFSAYFSHVNTRLKIPLRALLLVTVICCLICLINIGSTTAFYAVLSLGALALYGSYLLPVLFFLYRKLVGPSVQYGPFNMGGLSTPITIYAAVWLVFVLFWTPWPQFLPVTTDTMNWSSPIFVGVVVLAIADWCIGGRKRFRVPTTVEDSPYVE
ncbi:putative amino acid permease [Pseudovirgaria hyperparasitica]|uniref:Putative amino acid permease n=1 Tax=Pseudovirgaria hyperparasitica TaxID=470096 RepID=A0A6A6W8Z3_9PEZI|nr:putative amino acid permease [Pseudovirgaria hyperparasitica]KAF2759348.1 putative amino acid permease [Pseudovirgaria hyperparasitica]